MLILAYDENDNIVHIKDAEKGKSYRCPDCGAEVRPRKGTKKTHHFFHMNAEDCGNSGESIVHKYYKELIASQKTVQYNDVEMIVTNSKIEQTLPNLLTDSHIIADVMLELNGYKWIAVEVCYKNHKDENHVDIYNALDMECFEVYVDMNDEKTDFEIKNYKKIASIKQYANKVNEKIKHELSLMTVGKQAEVANARYEERKKCYDEISELRDELREKITILKEIDKIVQNSIGYELNSIAYKFFDLYGHGKTLIELMEYCDWRIKDNNINKIQIEIGKFDEEKAKKECRHIDISFYSWNYLKIFNSGTIKIIFYSNEEKIETLTIYRVRSFYTKELIEYTPAQKIQPVLYECFQERYRNKKIEVMIK